LIKLLDLIAQKAVKTNISKLAVGPVNVLSVISGRNCFIKSTPEAGKTVEPEERPFELAGAEKEGPGERRRERGDESKKREKGREPE
jgi:hypothetical protein